MIHLPLPLRIIHWYKGFNFRRWSLKYAYIFGFCIYEFRIWNRYRKPQIISWKKKEKKSACLLFPSTYSQPCRLPPIVSFLSASRTAKIREDEYLHNCTQCVCGSVLSNCKRCEWGLFLICSGKSFCEWLRIGSIFYIMIIWYMSETTISFPSLYRTTPSATTKKCW